MTTIGTKIFLAEMDRKAPRLVKAVKLILYDNGMVFRDNPEASALDEAFGRIVRVFDDRATLVIDETERDLQKLSDDDLENLCVGGDEHRHLGSEQTNRVLNLAFEDE